MKKWYAIGFGLFLLTVPTLGFSLDLDNTTAGEAIDFSGDNAPDNSEQDFKFQPSPNVRTMGATTASSFSVAAFNNSAIGADGGEAYGLASDESGTYILNISEATDDTAVAVGDDGNSADFASPWVAPTAAE